jgi:hypothetical protein
MRESEIARKRDGAKKLRLAFSPLLAPANLS